LKYFKDLFGQTAIYGVSTIIGKFLNYLLVPLYTYKFATEEYGQVALLYTYAGLLLVFLSYGMETTYFRFIKLKNSEFKIFNNASLNINVTTLFFIIIIIFFRDTIAKIIGFPGNPEYILWFGFILAFDTLCALPFARLRHQNKAGRFALFKIINIGTNIALNLFFILLCPFLHRHFPGIDFFQYLPATPQIEYIFISNFVAGLVTVILLLKSILSVQFKFDIPLFREMIIYALPLLIVGIAGMANQMIDRILLQNFIIPPDSVADTSQYIMSQIGIYAANAKIAGFILILNMGFRFAAEPFFFSFEGHKDEKIIYADVLKYYTIFSLFCFLCMTYFIDVIKYFIGADYHEGSYVIPLLAIAYVFHGIVFNLSMWYKLANKTRIGAYITIIGTTISVFINILLIPALGYLGSAIAALCCYSAMTIISYFLGQKYYKIPYDIKRIFIYILITLSLHIFVYIFVDFNIYIKYLFYGILIIGYICIVLYREKEFYFSLKKYLAKIIKHEN
jgi:O-antigen/teichoic acid export membrane protein